MSPDFLTNMFLLILFLLAGTVALCIAELIVRLIRRGM